MDAWQAVHQASPKVLRPAPNLVAVPGCDLVPTVLSPHTRSQPSALLILQPIIPSNNVLCLTDLPQALHSKVPKSSGLHPTWSLYLVATWSPTVLSPHTRSQPSASRLLSLRASTSHVLLTGGTRARRKRDNHSEQAPRPHSTAHLSGSSAA
jgi:hypothetical protein